MAETELCLLPSPKSVVYPPSPPSSEFELHLESIKSKTDVHDLDSGDSSSGTDYMPTLRKTSRSSRVQRNLAEKQRRDKLNTCIGKLATMVPLVSMSNKRINKSGILRLTACYLRLHYGLVKVLKTQNEGRPLFLTNDEFSELLSEAVGGFMMIISESSKVVYVTEGIEKVLGHSVIDVLGRSIDSLVHPDDHVIVDRKIRMNLISWDCHSNRISENSEQERRGVVFYCSMLEHVTDPKSIPYPSYKLVNIIGRFKLVSNSISGKVGKYFIGIVKVCKTNPCQQLTIYSNPNEVSFRSSLDGRCLFIDQRLSVLLGYLPSEVVGKSGYEMIFQDDHALCAYAHTQLLTKGGFSGLPVRLVSSLNTLMHFSACGRLVCSVENSTKPDTLYLVCTLISNEEGEKALALARHRFIPYTGTLDFMNIGKATLDTTSGSPEIQAVEREIHFQTSQELPLKRPRGRPRKYPIPLDKGSSAVPINGNPKSQTGEGLPVSIKQSVENFARAYATTLQLQASGMASSAISDEFTSDMTETYPLLFEDIDDCCSEDLLSQDKWYKEEMDNVIPDSDSFYDDPKCVGMSVGDPL